MSSSSGPTIPDTQTQENEKKSWLQTIRLFCSTVWEKIRTSSAIHRVKKRVLGRNFRKKSLYMRDDWKHMGSFRSLHAGVRITVLLLCMVLIIGFGGTIRGYVQSSFSSIGYHTVKTVSSYFGTPMQKDMNGNINVLLIGVGGESHAGGYLADSVIVASLDTETNVVTMISIPRDLYVNYKNTYQQKVNALFAWKYNTTQEPEGLDPLLVHKYKIDQAAQALTEKSSEITGLEIPYYAVIDFAGFEGLIDSLGGIRIEVPYAIYDTSYPGPNNTYQTFSIPAGEQILDGETALKYARSRKTTSDFSRSQRQQAIIKAIMEQLTQTENLTSVGTMRDLYNQFNDMVTTNISRENFISMIDIGYDMPHIASFGYTTQCMNNAWRTMVPGCMMYYPPQEDFGGMATVLPAGATAGNVSFYDYTAYFAYVAAHKSGIHKENPRIYVRNAIDPDYARSFPYRQGLAGKTASKLARYGFDIQEVDNAPENTETTTVYVSAENEYPASLEVLRLFIPAFDVQILTGDVMHDIHIHLGNDYLERVGSRPFNYYK